MKFHQFCPPLEKILPTPMCSSRNKGYALLPETHKSSCLLLKSGISVSAFRSFASSLYSQGSYVIRDAEISSVLKHVTCDGVFDCIRSQTTSKHIRLQRHYARACINFEIGLFVLLNSFTFDNHSLPMVYTEKCLMPCPIPVREAFIIQDRTETTRVFALCSILKKYRTTKVKTTYCIKVRITAMYQLNLPLNYSIS